MPCSFPRTACDDILLSHISLVHGGITMKLSLPDHYLNFARLNFRNGIVLLKVFLIYVFTLYIVECNCQITKMQDNNMLRIYDES
ncbi:hypothetical protein Zmor_014458 [Zophobas morio]|uniref:Uncharacterized protein n=1 Tax=Zophobas morio TaxID=2755281 RepID=A0AA38IHM2_9CUCU|nr:hypothetical protein Zmor_014458 [Zophobas morio]